MCVLLVCSSHTVLVPDNKVMSWGLLALCCVYRYDKYDNKYDSYDDKYYSDSGYSAEDYSSSGSGDYSGGSGDYYKEPEDSDSGYGDYSSGDSSYKDYPTLKVNKTGSVILKCTNKHKWPGAWSINVCVSAKSGECS